MAHSWPFLCQSGWFSGVVSPEVVYLGSVISCRFVSVRDVRGPSREALRVPAKEHAMAMNQSALLDMVDALKSADGGELMRRMLAMTLQELIDA